MFVAISTTHRPATDLGYLLHKSPWRVHEKDLGFGIARVFYSEASEDRATAVLWLDVDSVGLVRGAMNLEQYVTDRTYAASSFLSVALRTLFGTAMSGSSKERPELVESALPLEVEIPVIRVRGGLELLTRLFEPLGYTLRCEELPLDGQYPEWGDSNYFAIQLSAEKTVRDVLRHLYVLIPVLDDSKHYALGDDEVAKLLRHGEDWIATHPQRDEITRRYLRRPSLVREAIARLADDVEDPDAQHERADEAEATIEKPISLHTIRLQAVVDELKNARASRVLDLGCGEGRLIRMLVREPSIEEIIGVDISLFVLQRLKRHVEKWPIRASEKVKLLHGGLNYRDERLKDFPAAAIVEVIEHLDPERLHAFERVVFEFARPRTVVLTTPNREYNALFEGMAPGAMRHPDHRFEWTRAEFSAWAERVAGAHGYHVELKPLGPEHEEFGAPSQMGVFTR